MVTIIQDSSCPPLPIMQEKATIMAIAHLKDYTTCPSKNANVEVVVEGREALER
jgi:hypothetical protein